MLNLCPSWALKTLGPIDFHQMDKNKCNLEYLLCSTRGTKVKLFWNHMRVSRWWQNFHFWVKCNFNLNKLLIMWLVHFLLSIRWWRWCRSRSLVQASGVVLDFVWIGLLCVHSYHDWELDPGSYQKNPSWGRPMIKSWCLMIFFYNQMSYGVYE